MCVAASPGESTGLVLENAESCDVGCSGKQVSRDTFAKGHQAPIDFLEVWGGCAEASRGPACRGYRAGRQWGSVCGDDPERKSAERGLLDRIDRTEPQCIIRGPLRAIRGRPQKVVYKGGQAGLQEARVEEMPTLDLAKRIFLATRAALEKRCGEKGAGGCDRVELTGDLLGPGRRREVREADRGRLRGDCQPERPWPGGRGRG